MSLLITCTITIVVMLFINCIAKSKWLNSPDKVLIDLDEYIGIKMGVISRFFNLSPLVIPKSKIVKIQHADCISLFYASGHSVDIWPSNGELEDIFTKAKILLPNAEVSIIAS